VTLPFPDPPTLFDPVEPPPSIEDQFQAFHKRHPEVYRLLVTFARQAKVRSKRVGIRLLWERLRWEFYIERDEEFKLNNNMTALYARRIMEHEHDLAGFFETRERR
jgi:hypothetical protein